jgi:hypothetical protein
MRILIEALALILWVAFGLEEAIAQSTSDKARRENLDLQERCATQAQKVFKQWKSEYDKESEDQRYADYVITSADYQSHYNAKLNRCFIAVEDSMADGSTHKWLADAYENRPYASYWTKYLEMRPRSCELTPSVREKHFCNSEEEYNEFVATYME